MPVIWFQRQKPWHVACICLVGNATPWLQPRHAPEGGGSPAGVKQHSDADGEVLMTKPGCSNSVALAALVGQPVR
jgi:hypothetical protein